MNLKKVLIPAGSWAALLLGAAFLIVYAIYGGQGNLALAVSFLALSLSIKTYGQMQK